MNCQRFRESLPLFAGKDLDDAAHAELRTHLRECPACASKVEALGAQRTLLKSYGRQNHEASAPPGLWARLRDRLPEGSPVTALRHEWPDRRIRG